MQNNLYLIIKLIKEKIVLIFLSAEESTGVGKEKGILR